MRLVRSCPCQHETKFGIQEHLGTAEGRATETAWLSSPTVRHVND